MSNLTEKLREKQSQNYYDVLEVAPNVTTTALRSARRKMLSIYHPDKHDNEDKEIATKITSIMNEAFEALSDTEFRNKYDASGYSLSYNASNMTVVTRSEKLLENSKDKGTTLSSYITVKKETLLNGEEIAVNPIPIEGLDIDYSPRIITIPPLTSVGTMMVFSGLGEKKEDESLNGDLIVVIMCNEPLTETETKLLSPKSTATLISPEYQNQKIKMPPPFLSDIPFEKKGNKDNLLIITETIETGNSKGLLIKV